jgi:hypothetical protein
MLGLCRQGVADDGGVHHVVREPPGRDVRQVADRKQLQLDQRHRLQRPRHEPTASLHTTTLPRGAAPELPPADLGTVSAWLMTAA